MSNLGNLIMNDIPWDFPADCFSLLSPLGRLWKLHLIFGCLSGQLHKMLSECASGPSEGPGARIPGVIPEPFCIGEETSLDFQSCEAAESLRNTDCKADVLDQPVAVDCYRRERCRSEIGLSFTHSFIFTHSVRAKQTAKNGYETLTKIRVLSS